MKVSNFMETLCAVLEIPAAPWQVPAYCSGNHKTEAEFLCSHRQCLPKKSCFQFFPIWNPELCPDLESSECWAVPVGQKATVQSALLGKFLEICLLRWSLTIGLAHSALDNAYRSSLQVFDPNVYYNSCEFNLKKICYIGKKIHAEVSSCSSKNIEDRISKFKVTECWNVF